MPRAKGIIRIDSGSTHGWQVRVHRNTRTYSRLFSDRRYGGGEEAFREAVAYREALEEEVAALPEAAPHRRLVESSKENRSGVIGVCRTSKRAPSGKRHEVYTASWNPEPGAARGTSYSIKKHGEEGAFERACKRRWEEMKAIHGDAYDVPSYGDLVRRKRG